MHNTLRVGHIERIRNLNPERQQRLHLQRTPANAMLQRHPLQKFHGDEGTPVLFADVVNGANVGMIQSRCRLRLTLKASQAVRIEGDLFGQELKSDETV